VNRPPTCQPYETLPINAIPQLKSLNVFWIYLFLRVCHLYSGKRLDLSGTKLTRSFSSTRGQVQPRRFLRFGYEIASPSCPCRPASDGPSSQANIPESSSKISPSIVVIFKAIYIFILKKTHQDTGHEPKALSIWPCWAKH
jgi:hypothetical protein